MGNDQYISSNHCYYTDLRKHASFKKNNCWLVTIYPVSSIVLKDFYPLLYLIFTLIVEEVLFSILILQMKKLS